MSKELNRPENQSNETEELNKLTELAQADFENLNIPESLSPENVEQMLKDKRSVSKPGKSTHWVRYVSIAASVAVVIAIGAVVGTTLHRSSLRQNASTSANASASTPLATAQSEHPSDLGGILHRASSMDDIMAVVTPSSSFSVSAFGVEDVAIVEDSASGTSDADSNAYSTTNLQVDGVDEGDIIKTDGTYIYQLVCYNSVRISRNDEGNLSEIASITFEQSESGFSASELYLDSERGLLVVIGQCYGQSLYDTYISDDDAPQRIENSYSSAATYVYTYDISDPSNPILTDTLSQDGCLCNSRMVDGYLYLFTGIYDFEFFVSDDTDGTHLYTETDDPDDAQLVLPYVDGYQLSCSDVYVPDESSQNETLISAVSITDDGAMSASDALSVIDPYMNLYMSSDSIYLYYESWPDVEENIDGEDIDTVNYMSTQTVVAKFTYKDGTIYADAATTVGGYLRDTFAISENDGYLYLLTEQDEYSDDGDFTWHNTLRVLDSSLNSCGEIAEIAPDEEIYAARFIGDMAYFITYQEIDPLFVADLSDPTNPKLLGSVEISGFSEYLHPFGDNLLLGIGFETVDNGYGGLQSDTVKLVMFDVTNPLNPTILDAIEIPNSFYTAAAYDYKLVLTNTDTGLIGLPVDVYTSENQDYSVEYYDCFYWNGSEFVAAASLDPCEALDQVECWQCRGSYMGDWLILSNDNGIISYDMENDFTLKTAIDFD